MATYENMIMTEFKNFVKNNLDIEVNFMQQGYIEGPSAKVPTYKEADAAIILTGFLQFLKKHSIDYSALYDFNIELNKLKTTRLKHYLSENLVKAIPRDVFNAVRTGKPIFKAAHWMGVKISYMDCIIVRDRMLKCGIDFQDIDWQCNINVSVINKEGKKANFSVFFKSDEYTNGIIVTSVNRCTRDKNIDIVQFCHQDTTGINKLEREAQAVANGRYDEIMRRR